MSENGRNKTIELPPTITVRELAKSIEASPIEVIKTLMANGVMANINQQIDFDTAAIVAAEMGYEAVLETPQTAGEEDTGEIPLWRKLIADEESQNLSDRPPVVTILGHVDHGKTLLFDEPNTGLDPITAAVIDRVIVEMREHLPVTMVTITHAMESAFRIADRVAMLHDGRIIALAPPEQFRTLPDPYIQKFLKGEPLEEEVA